MFTSSATECWEIIVQSIVETGSLHVFNGSFGEKWFDYTSRLNSNTQKIPFFPEETIPKRKIDSKSNFDTICITQNETSNGTQVSNEELAEIRKHHPEKMIAVDATSSMAGVYLDFSLADIWYASVQKCFGLPAGLALLICSKKAVNKAQEINERSHYNSLCFMLDKIVDAQTPFTPNVMGIYLLNQTLKRRKNIKKIDQRISDRFSQWQKLIDRYPAFYFYIKNKEVRSKTVIVLSTKTINIEKLKNCYQNTRAVAWEWLWSTKRKYISHSQLSSNIQKWH